MPIFTASGVPGVPSAAEKRLPWSPAEDTPMVRAINKVIGGTVEQRTLTDFNYDTPFVSIR